MKWEANIKSDPEKKKQYQEYERQRKADQRKKKKQDQQQKLFNNPEATASMYQCPDCQEWYPTRGGLACHRAIKHKERSYTQNTKKQ